MTREAGGENLSIPLPDWETPPTQPSPPPTSPLTAEAGVAGP